MWRFKDFGSAVAAESDTGDSITYAQLDKLASDLKAITGRALVFQLCTNSVGSMAGYAAMINAHIVPVMISADLDRDLLKRLMDEYKPEYIWLPSTQMASFTEMEEVFSAHGYSLLKTGEQSHDMFDELALLLTTS